MPKSGARGRSEQTHRPRGRHMSLAARGCGRFASTQRRRMVPRQAPPRSIHHQCRRHGRGM